MMESFDEALGLQHEGEVPDEYVRRSALPRSPFEDAVDIARRMKAEDVAEGRPARPGPMCGPHLDEATVERQKLIADAILLERAQQALIRRVGDNLDRYGIFAELGAYALLWRTQAEAPG
jgi:hypothetical protein